MDYNLVCGIETTQSEEAIRHMAGIKKSTEDYKCTRPSEIIKSERRVAKVKEVLANESLIPFDHTLDQEYLFKIGSGIQVDQGLADGILASKERGEDLYNTFLQYCIPSTKEKSTIQSNTKKNLYSKTLAKK